MRTPEQMREFVELTDNYEKIKKYQKGKIEGKEALKEIEVNKKKIQESNNRYDKAKDLIDAKPEVKYKEGVASSLELSQTQNQYLSVEGNYIKALLELLKSRSMLDTSYGIK